MAFIVTKVMCMVHDSPCQDIWILLVELCRHVGGEVHFESCTVEDERCTPRFMLPSRAQGGVCIVNRAVRMGGT